MWSKRLIILLVSLLCLNLIACSKQGTVEENDSTDKSSKLITVGFSQVGAESDWRSANSKSMKEAFTLENGYRLIFEDGQQKQTNQIMAIRSFIQQEVDYIVLAPVTEAGWDTVLQEAKEANIPVIIVDRMVDIEDESLFSCWIGSDFELEGMKVTKWLKDYLQEEGISSRDINIVDLQGNIGSTAQIGRSEGIKQAAKENGWNLLEQIPADFTQTKGKEVMEACLKKYDNLNVVYCENDNMAFGAIEAIEQAGKVVGSDIKNGQIMVLSFDGVNEKALKYILQGKISCLAECNPLHGPRVKSVIEAMEQGNEPVKFSYVTEEIYVSDEKIETIEVNGLSFSTKQMTNSLVLDKSSEFGN